MKDKSKILPSIILSMVLSSVIISCSKKYDKSKTEISNFKINDYEFTVFLLQLNIDTFLTYLMYF